MLDGRNGVLAAAEYGRAARIGDELGARRDRNRTVEAESKTAAGLRRADTDAGGETGVQSDALELDRIAQRRLIMQVVGFQSSSELDDFFFLPSKASTRENSLGSF